MYFSIKTYFEKAKYKRNMLNKWNKTTLQSIMAKLRNKDKSMEKCLQLLVDKLQDLQQGLSSEFQNDDFIHNKLVTVCRDVLACKYACYKSSSNLVDLINDLRFSIITFNETHQTENFFID